MKMKGIDLFCSSPASTAICVSLDQSMVHLSTSRAIDRHNPHLRDPRRRARSTRPLLPSSSTPSSSSSSTPSTSTSSSSSSHQKPSKPSKPSNSKAKLANHNKGKKKISFSKSSKPSNDSINTSPPGSSRYLLSDSVFFDVFSEYEPADSALVSFDSKVNQYDDSPPSQKPSSSSSCASSSSPSSSTSTTTTTMSHDQVVVLRVSLHCKGCEGKVRKHISKMQGVRSFTIDFATKKVTIIGDVTPLGVLASVSRVKNAQFWQSSSSSSSSLPSSLVSLAY